MSRSQCRRRVALGTGVRQVNHSEALGGQQDSMAFIKIRLVRLFTALAVKTRKKRAIFTSDETKTTIMLRARKKEGKTNYQIFKRDLRLILTPGVERTPNLLQL